MLLNSCDGNDAKQRVFLVRLLMAVKRGGCVVHVLALKSAGFSLVDVRSDVPLPSRMQVNALSNDQRIQRFVTCLLI